MAAQATFTVADWERLPEEEARRYELVKGELVEVATGNLAHNALRIRLSSRLERYVTDPGLGQVVDETDFRMGSDTVRRPDVALIAPEDWERLDKGLSTIPCVPILVAEIVSPSDGFQSLMEKVDEYLEAGVDTVWVVSYKPHPEVWTFEKSRGPNVMGLGATLEAPRALPGFQLAVAELFRGFEG